VGFVGANEFPASFLKAGEKFFLVGCHSGIIKVEKCVVNNWQNESFPVWLKPNLQEQVTN
jgi:hypothetical protein